MIEVFKTNIASKSKAKEVLLMLNNKFPNYKVNFDLEDCDNILRIENKNGTLKINDIIYLLLRTEIVVEILPD
ncbi:hypothetical protein [Confluentibacter sediminis]|uniref:hypothetical protein n=1 Tax=Confluentibacter sediminis TaxID=2219045 RepID=UPI000DAC60B8|nr:hypothetical protein [Confluentibacter sediminis]